MEFDEIYARYAGFVRRSIRRLGVPETAVDDVAQDVFLVVYRRLPSFEGRSSMKTWLFAIVRRVIADYRRARVRRNAFLSIQLTSLDPRATRDAAGMGPLDAALWAEEVRVVQGALSSMSDAHREILVLADVEQMPATEIAGVLGENLNTIYSRIRAARREFERRVSAGMQAHPHSFLSAGPAWPAWGRPRSARQPRACRTRPRSAR
jgi:RNA polymerase sigma-70 factor, ECF subfamily